MRAKCVTFLLILLTACSAPQTQIPSATIPPTLKPTPTDHFAVKVWVTEPDPKPGQVVGLMGSLIKNGVYLNGIMMSGYWQQPGEDTPSQHCYDMATYQRGKCPIVVEGFPENVFVPLKIQFIYDDMIFTAETGFTPRSK